MVEQSLTISGVVWWTTTNRAVCSRRWQRRRVSTLTA